MHLNFKIWEISISLIKSSFDEIISNDNRLDSEYVFKILRNV